MTSDIVWKTTTLPDCIVGIPYQAGLAFTGAASAVTAGSVTTGALPTSGNLVVNATDHVRITGTAKAVDVGTYSFKVTLTDSAAAGPASGTFGLTVRFINNGDYAGIAAAGLTADIPVAEAGRQWPTVASDT